MKISSFDPSLPSVSPPLVSLYSLANFYKHKEKNLLTLARVTLSLLDIPSHLYLKL